MSGDRWQRIRDRLHGIREQREQQRTAEVTGQRAIRWLNYALAWAISERLATVDRAVLFRTWLATERAGLLLDGTMPDLAHVWNEYIGATARDEAAAEAHRIDS